MGLLLVGRTGGASRESRHSPAGRQAGWIVKLVLLALAVASVVSWAIIAFKWRELRRRPRIARRSSRHITRDRSTRRTKSRASSCTARSHRSFSKRTETRAHRALRGSLAVERLGDLQRRAVERQISWTASRETHRLERGLEFLATTGQCGAVRRPLRHRDRHHHGLRGNREGGFRESRRRRRPASPSADRDGRRTRRRDSGDDLLQPFRRRAAAPRRSHRPVRRRVPCRPARSRRAPGRRTARAGPSFMAQSDATAAR